MIIHFRRRSYASQARAENWLIDRCNKIEKATIDEWFRWVKLKAAEDVASLPGYLVKLLFERLDYLEGRVEHLKNNRRR